MRHFDLVHQLRRQKKWNCFSIFCAAFGLRYGDSLDSDNGHAALEALDDYLRHHVIPPEIVEYARRELVHDRRDAHAG